MLGDVLPGAEARVEAPPAVQRRPVDDGDDEGVDDNGGVEERVQGLQGTGKGVEGGAVGTAEGVGGCVEGGDEEVEGDAPEGEDGEEGEGAGDGAAAVVGAGAAVDDADEARGEGVDSLLIMLALLLLFKGCDACERIVEEATGGGRGALAMRARHAKSSQGLRSQDVWNRLEGSQRSVPKEKTPMMNGCLGLKAPRARTGARRGLVVLLVLVEGGECRQAALDEQGGCGVIADATGRIRLCVWRGG